MKLEEIYREELHWSYFEHMEVVTKPPGAVIKHGGIGNYVTVTVVG